MLQQYRPFEQLADSHRRFYPYMVGVGGNTKMKVVRSCAGIILALRRAAELLFFPVPVAADISCDRESVKIAKADAQG
jgi:hypothetical protein